MQPILNYLKENYIPLSMLGGFIIFAIMEFIITKIKKPKDSFLRNIIFTAISLIGVLSVLKLIENDLFVWMQNKYNNALITNIIIGGTVIVTSGIITIGRSLLFKRKFNPFVIQFISIASLFSVLIFYYIKEKTKMYEQIYIALLFEMVFTSFLVSLAKFNKGSEKIEKVIALLSNKMKQENEEENEESEEEETEDSVNESQNDEEILTVDDIHEEEEEELEEVIVKEFEMSQELLLEDPSDRTHIIRIPKTKAKAIVEEIIEEEIVETPVEEEKIDNSASKINDDNLLPFDETPIEEEVEEIIEEIIEEEIEQSIEENNKEELHELIEGIENVIEDIEDRMDDVNDQTDSETLEEMVEDLEELMEEAKKPLEPEIVDGILIMPDQEEIKRAQEQERIKNENTIANEDDLDSLIENLQVQKAPSQNSQAQRKSSQPRQRVKKASPQLNPEQRELELIERRLRRLKKQIANRNKE